MFEHKHKPNNVYYNIYSDYEIASRVDKRR